MAAHQAPQSLGFSRQEYWSELPFPSPMHACMLSRFSHVRLYATPWRAAHQAPPSRGLSRQEYRSGLPIILTYAFLVAQSVKNLPAVSLFPGLGRSPGEGNGKPFQYSCLKNLMDRGAWWAIQSMGHKSQAPLS